MAMKVVRLPNGAVDVQWEGSPTDEETSQSTSEDSSDPQVPANASGPQPLPPPRPRARKQKTSPEATSNYGLPPKRPLPEDPKEFDEGKRRQRMMVAPILTGVSRLGTVFGAQPMDKDERVAGEVAWGALLYQEGANFDARFM